MRDRTLRLFFDFFVVVIIGITSLGKTIALLGVTEQFSKADPVLSFLSIADVMSCATVAEIVVLSIFVLSNNHTLRYRSVMILGLAFLGYAAALRIQAQEPATCPCLGNLGSVMALPVGLQNFILRVVAIMFAFGGWWFLIRQKKADSKLGI